VTWRTGPGLAAIAGLAVVAYCLLAATVPSLRVGDAKPRLYLIGAAVAGVVTVASGALLLNDAKTRALESAPGRHLVFPRGRLLEDATSTSIAGRGASSERTYGTNASAEDIMAFYDEALRRLGYTDSGEQAAGPDAQGTRLLASYRNGEFTYRIYLAKLPKRVKGFTYTTEFAHMLVTKLSD
jgi:hypothetical protein